MSLDDRLREGLGLSASGLDARFFDGTLEGVIVGGRRRRRRRRGVAATLIVLTLGVATVFGPKVLDALRSLEGPRPVDSPPEDVGSITTVAGTGTAGSWGDGAAATDADLDYPGPIAFGPDGSLYIVELERVRKVDPSGTITTVVGSPVGDDPPLGEAGRLTPGGHVIAVDAAGNIYVTRGASMVVKVTPTGAVTRVAGTGEAGYSGDGGPATEARLGNVYDIALDDRGNLYIVDSRFNLLRRVDGAGVITTLAGTGRKGFSGDGGPATAATFNDLDGVAVDARGNIYLADTGNGRIRRIDRRGIITTIAGPGENGSSGNGGPAIHASFYAEHVCVDPAGNLYFADAVHNTIREIDADGIITTVAGTGARGYSGDDGPAIRARFHEPGRAIIGPDGALYVSDNGNNRVRRIVLPSSV
jgi:hypothetical protein